MGHFSKPLRRRTRLQLYAPKHEMGQVLHHSFPLLCRPDYREAFLSHQGTKAYQLAAMHLPEAERNGIADCLDFLHEFINLADSYEFEPVMDGYVHDLRMYHRQRGYVVEIKTVWRDKPQGEITKKFGKGQRQVKHGMAQLRQLTGDRMEIFGCVLGFVIYADGSPMEVVWGDELHYLPSLTSDML